ncbi:MAG: hypothetical protein O3B70_09485 [Bacteroidetes bacterium]|nr:hypothetical protein [Bacteroidota bacterium]
MTHSKQPGPSPLLTLSHGCRLGLLWASLLPSVFIAQTVEILSASNISRNPDITTAQRFVGDVMMSHKDAVLRCDSAWRFDNGEVEIFGHVRMDQPPSTTLQAQYLRLRPNEEWAEARGEVVMTHDGGRLQAPELGYHIGARKARYRQGATIAQEGWKVESQTGLYNAPHDRLELGGGVRAVRDLDTLRSDSLHWLRAEDRYFFLGPTSWHNNQGFFACLRGDVVMDDAEEQPTGWLAGEVHVREGDNTVSADSLRWGKGCSETWGEVRLTDPEVVVEGSYARRDSRDSTDAVWGHPARLTQSSSGDTLQVEALHLWKRGELLKARDSVQFTQGEIRGQGDSLTWQESTSTPTPTPGPNDSRLDLWGTPRLWVNEDALAGDTMRIFLSNRQPTLLELRGHAVVRTPANDSLQHLIQGRTLDAHFTEGVLHDVEVHGNVELTYWNLPEADSPDDLQSPDDPKSTSAARRSGNDPADSPRVNHAVCAEATLSVENRRIVGIHLRGSPSGRVEPVSQPSDDAGE